MSISPTLNRRILATILFISSTFGVLMFLPHNPLLQRFWGNSSDIPVYALIFILFFILILVLTSLILSQNIQFLITLQDNDERSQLIKKDIILKSFFGTFLILTVWLFGQYLLSPRVENWLLASNLYWINFGGYFVLVPVLIFPFIVALWTDGETQLINPFLTIKSYLISSSKIILVPLIICVAFGSLAINDLLIKYPIDLLINPSDIKLQGDANFEIEINTNLDYTGRIDIDSNKFYYDHFLLIHSEGFIKGNQSFPMNLTSPTPLLIVAPYTIGLTQQIFNTPNVKIQLRELKTLTLTNAKSVRITMPTGMCLDSNTFKLTLEGQSKNNPIELPCNAKPTDFKNLEDLRF